MSPKTAVFVAGAFLSAAPAVPAQEGFTPNHLFGLDPLAAEVQELDPNGDLVRTFGSGAGDWVPQALEFGPDGLLYVVDIQNDRVVVFNASGGVVQNLGSSDDLSAPRDLAFGPLGHLFVASSGQAEIVDLGLDGSSPAAYSGTWVFPSALGFGPHGRLFVADDSSDVVYDVSAGGAVIRDDIGQTSGLTAPWGVAVTPEGDLLAVSRDQKKLYRYLVGGGHTGTITPPQAGSFAFLYRATFGPDDLLYLSGPGAIDGAARITLDGQDMGEAQSFDGPYYVDVAFAPFRLEAKVTGVVTQSGWEPAPVIPKHAVLTIAPGVNRVALRFEDDPAKTGDVPSLFGGTHVFHGTWARVKGGAKKRRFLGFQRPPEDLANAIGSIRLDVKGKTKNGRFAVKSASGRLLLGGPDASLQAKVKAKKLVP